MFLQKLKFESQRNVAQKESTLIWRKNFLLSKLHLKEWPTYLTLGTLVKGTTYPILINLHFFSN